MQGDRHGTRPPKAAVVRGPIKIHFGFDAYKDVEERAERKWFRPCIGIGVAYSKN